MGSSYDHYRIFYYVAKYQNVTQAAAALLSSQPNVTRAVKNLETELGCILFVRSNRGMVLTPEGKKLYAHVSAAFNHIEAAQRELALDKGLQQGIITIGASEVALHCFLLPVLKRYRTLYPGVRLRLYNYSTPQAISALRDGKIDLAIVTTPVELHPNMKMTELKEIREIAVCGSSYADLASTMLSLKELSEYPVISLGQRTMTYQFYNRLFCENDLPFSPDIEAATANQILPMVKHNLGIGFVPEQFLLDNEGDHTVFQLHLKEAIPVRSVCMVKRSDVSLCVAAKELEQMLLDSRM